jgi:hypothetical protein
MSNRSKYRANYPTGQPSIARSDLERRQADFDNAAFLAALRRSRCAPMVLDRPPSNWRAG